jgi:PAS domain S-box-containing protein
MLTMTHSPSHNQSHVPFRAEAVLENLPDGFQAFDREWRYVYLNRRAEQLLGRPREALLGKVCWNEYPEVVGSPLHARFLEAMAAGQPIVFEELSPQQGGDEPAWFEFSLNPLNPSPMGEGDGEGLTVLQRDITGRKQAEGALRRSQAELEDFFENATVGLHWVDASGTILRANRAELEMLGYRPEEYIGHSIAAFHADADVIADILRRLAAGEALHDYEAQLRCKDGSLRHVLVSSNVLFENGAFIHTRCFTRDVTDRDVAQAERIRADEAARVAAELLASQEALLASADALRASEERFRLLVAGVRDYAIFLLDPAGNVVTWNAGAERFKGYREEEIVGKHFSVFYTQEDIQRRHPWKELEIATLKGKYEEEGWRIRKDGSRFFASVVITALKDEAGELKGFAKVTRDVTERRAREQEQAAAQTAEQQRRFLKEVLASVTAGRLVLCDTPADLPARLRPTPLGTPMTLSRESLKELRAQVQQVAAAWGLARERVHDLLTGVGEASMNAVVHAGGGTASVYADVEACRIQVWVGDPGKGIDLGLLPRATLERGFSSAGTLGHGFWLMLRTCERDK